MYILIHLSRHSRFGGTFVVTNQKSIVGTERVYHRPVAGRHMEGVEKEGLALIGTWRGERRRVYYWSMSCEIGCSWDSPDLSSLSSSSHHPTVTLPPSQVYRSTHMTLRRGPDALQNRSELPRMYPATGCQLTVLGHLYIHVPPYIVAIATGQG